MSNKLSNTTLQDKYIRLLKPLLDQRGNLYLAKDYAPGELPEFILNKGKISIIDQEDLDVPFQDFKTVVNTIPETKVEVQVSSSKKTQSKKVEVQNLTPLEAPNPTTPKKDNVPT